MVEWLFFTVPRGCLLFVFVVFSDQTHLLFYCSTVSLTVFACFVDPFCYLCSVFVFVIIAAL